MQDFLRKAKQIEYLISILPPHHDPTHSSKPPVQSSPSSSPRIAQHPKSKTNPTTKTHLQTTELETKDQESRNTAGDDTNTVESNEVESEGDPSEFERLQAGLNDAQHEYEQALLDAESLHSEIKAALRRILDHRVKLLSSPL